MQALEQQPQSFLLSPASSIVPLCLLHPGDGNEAIGALIQNYIREIEEIIRFTQIPTDLYRFGVKREDLDFLVDAGSKQTRLLVNNKKELTLEDIRRIYQKVL